MKGYWKIPGRDVYCATFRVWLAEMIYCYVVLRLNPPNLPSLGDQ